MSCRLQGGSGVGKIKVGKSSNVRVGVDDRGLLIGLCIANDRPHESQLAEDTLASIRVLQKGGRPIATRKS